MTAQPLEAPALESITHLDFAPEHPTPCEGQHHARGLSGHVASKPAAFIVMSPCCGVKPLQCASRVAAMRESGLLYCGSCKVEHLTIRYRFIPLEGEQ
jgi:hypothetical protein